MLSWMIKLNIIKAAVMERERLDYSDDVLDKIIEEILQLEVLDNYKKILEGVENDNR